MIIPVSVFSRDVWCVTVRIYIIVLCPCLAEAVEESPCLKQHKYDVITECSLFAAVSSLPHVYLQPVQCNTYQASFTYQLKSLQLAFDGLKSV